MEYPNPQLFASWEHWASALIMALIEDEKVELTEEYDGRDTSGGPVGITLRPAVVAGRGKILRFKDESGDAGTNNITITPSGSEKIDEQNNYVISSDYGFVTLRCNGFNWFTV
jgi:hypothetical protein